MSRPTTSSDERAARETAVVELLASWGAAGMPRDADIMRALASVPRVPDLLRALQVRGRAFLPDDLRRDVDETVTVMGAGAMLKAPSFRARVEQLLARAAQALTRRVNDRGATVSAELASWALLLDREELAAALRSVWRSERSEGVSELLGALEDLERIHAAIDSGNRALVADLERRAVGERGASVWGHRLGQARAALESGDPVALYRARLLLQGIDAGETRRALEEESAEVRARVEELCARARQPLHAIGGPGGLAAQLAADAAEEAGRLAQASAAGGGPPDTFRPALLAWERTLGAVVSTDRAAPDGARRARQKLALAFQTEVAPLLQRQQAGASQGDLELEREAAAIAESLRESVAQGGRPFQAAVERAGALLQRARGSAETHLRAATGRLKAAASEVGSFLERTAEQIPTTRVVETRLRLEQVGGISAGGDPDAVAALERVLREDLEELRRLAVQAQKRRSSRDEAEREALRLDAARLSQVAPQRLARRLKSLADETERAHPDRLSVLRNEVDRQRVALEQGIRLAAGRTLLRGGRWTRKAGGRGVAQAPAGKAQEAIRSLESLSAALQKDDLKAIRDGTAAARAAVAALALPARPWFRYALVGAVLMVIVGALLAWHRMADRPQTYHLKLATQPRSAVHVWLVRDGEIVERIEYGGGNSGVSFDLRPGRYEVFVNERYTGRVVSVPGQREVTGIPIPAPNQ